MEIPMAMMGISGDALLGCRATQTSSQPRVGITFCGIRNEKSDAGHGIALGRLGGKVVAVTA
jgi:hypothetical protein